MQMVMNSTPGGESNPYTVDFIPAHPIWGSHYSGVRVVRYSEFQIIRELATQTPKDSATQVPDEVATWCSENGWIEPFWKEHRWWGFQGNAVMPTELPKRFSVARKPQVSPVGYTEAEGREMLINELREMRRVCDPLGVLIHTFARLLQKALEVLCTTYPIVVESQTVHDFDCTRLEMQIYEPRSHQGFPSDARAFSLNIRFSDIIEMTRRDLLESYALNHALEILHSFDRVGTTEQIVNTVCGDSFPPSRQCNHIVSSTSQRRVDPEQLW